MNIPPPPKWLLLLAAVFCWMTAAFSVSMFVMIPNPFSLPLAVWVTAIGYWNFHLWKKAQAH